MNLHKFIPAITVKEQNSWFRNEILKSYRVPSIKTLKSDVQPNTPSSLFCLRSFSRSRFFSRFSSFRRLLTDIYIPMSKIHETDSSRRSLPHVQTKAVRTLEKLL